ncbi:MAG: excinuclease ABC subunit UvrA, partial [Cytophagales bacterium]|nr:excinuclease ABC subunit UvrA [Cytophagales bacterium]
EQKTTSGNPRSTVGTQTEIYDFLRLLFARTGEAYSYVTGKKMVKQSVDQILNHIISHFDGQKLTILSPIVKGRKGHYRELFQQIRKMGYAKVRVNGEVQDITPKMQLDRYVTHDIEIVIDRIIAKEEDRFRISQSVGIAMQHGKGSLTLMDYQVNDHHFSKFLMDPETGISYNEPAPNTFSFNSPYGACPTCAGLGQIEEISEELIMPDKTLSLSRGGIAPLGEYRDIWIFRELAEILKAKKYSLTTPIKDIDKETLDYVLYGKIAGEPPATLQMRQDTFEGIINILEKQFDSGSEKVQNWVSEFKTYRTCPECNGLRLNKEALHFKIDNRNISELAQMDVRHLFEWFHDIESRLNDRQNTIAGEVLKEIRKRIDFLLDVGLDYLTLDRPMKTLSGGEAQRIRLATQIGTQLVGVLYILDEPSIGLHQRDNVKLIKALKNLRDHGNTVIVVEHDKDMMLASDYIIDIGPKAGRHGGSIVAAGTPQQFLKQGSVTARYLSGELGITKNENPRKGKGEQLVLRGANGNNLKNVTLELPLGKFICVTGVSGSGKSTLIHDTLVPILKREFYNSRKEPLTFETIEGLKLIDKVIEVDQSPIGRTPRSNPATYTGVFADIRELFTILPESKIRGYKSGRFSFNVKGGRCETCEGAGMRLIEMEFLPSIHVPCETCKGKRYNRETLEVRFKGKSISDILDMTVETAIEFFANQPKILRKIETLNEEIGRA